MLSAWISQCLHFVLNIPWISPELEFWKRGQGSKRLLSPGWVTAPSQAPLQCPDRMEPGTGPAADRQPPAPHTIPSPRPSWLSSKASGQLCLGGLAFHYLHLPTRAGRGEWGMAMSGGLLDLMAKRQESAGRGCRERAGAKGSRAKP